MEYKKNALDAKKSEQTKKKIDNVDFGLMWTLLFQFWTQMKNCHKTSPGSLYSPLISCKKPETINVFTQYFISNPEKSRFFMAENFF